MALQDELTNKINSILNDNWNTRKGQVVPSADDLKLSNDAVTLNGVVLYADMSGSTALVDNYKPWFAAAVYKCYLHCAAKIIRSQGGVITAYDGDRIMAAFIGDTKNTSAARAALKINWARIHIINPALAAKYPKSVYVVEHTIGIDRSDLFVSRTGIRGSNDLVWVGKAANHAAKLGDLPNSHPTRITKEVYDCLTAELQFTNGKSMWEEMSWTDMDRIIYRSNWKWSA